MLIAENQQTITKNKEIEGVSIQMKKKKKKEISIHCYAVKSQIICLRENKKIYQYNIVKLKNEKYIYKHAFNMLLFIEKDYVYTSVLKKQ